MYDDDDDDDDWGLMIGIGVLGRVDSNGHSAPIDKRCNYISGQGPAM